MFSCFSETHGEVIAGETGIDLSTIDFDAFMRERLGQELNGDGTLSFREVRAKRMSQLRGT